MASPWAVPVTALRRVGTARRHEVRHGPVGELVVAGSRVGADQEAEADVVLDVVTGGVEVSGRVRAPWSGSCRRCLRPVTGLLDVDVRELYQPAGRPGSADEEETYPLDGDFLDLAPLVRDALLLALPLAPLCRDDCAGLCPLCGADRTDALCTCTADAIDPRWAALDELHPGRPLGSPGGAHGAASP